MVYFVLGVICVFMVLRVWLRDWVSEVYYLVGGCSAGWEQVLVGLVLVVYGWVRWLDV